MSPFALSLIKYGLLVLLYLFVWRAARLAIRDVRGKPAPVARDKPARASKRSKSPAAVAVRTGEGKKVGTFKLAGQVEIGRSEQCSIHVDDTYASHVHARLFDKNGGWFVEDLGSTNGTFLNERKVAAPTEVRIGDRVRVGSTVLELRG